jgi:hypothetical protein
MEDRPPPTKLLKDWQQLMLGMREDQLAFHELILGKLCRAQTLAHRSPVWNVSCASAEGLRAWWHGSTGTHKTDCAI